MWEGEERKIGIPPTLSRFLESDAFKYFPEPPSLFTPFVAASTVALARRGVPHGSLGSWSDGGRRKWRGRKKVGRRWRGRQEGRGFGEGKGKMRWGGGGGEWEWEERVEGERGEKARKVKG